MKIWLTGDNHFFHNNIRKYCDRPFKSVEEMNEIMIERWNERISNDDMVIHIGDFSLCKFEESKKIFDRLNGKIKIVFKGNHDRKNILRRLGFKLWPISNATMLLPRIGLCNIRHKPTESKHVRVVLSGHSHETFKVRKRYDNIFVNVGVDQWEYRPVSLEEIKELLDAFD